MTVGLRRRDWLPEFVLLGMIWGSSFFFTRMAAPEFGPWSTALMRVSVAALDNVSITLQQGDRLGLIGGNGGRKRGSPPAR